MSDKEPKFTKWPWIYTGAHAGGKVISTDARRTIIHESPSNPMNEHVIANARLIAAAPRLYEALQAVSDYYSGSLDHQPHYVAMARSVLAAARGEVQGG